MTGWVMICVADRPMTRRQEVWADDPGDGVGSGRGPDRSWSLRGVVPTGSGPGDDGPGADDQRRVPGSGSLLVVPGPGPIGPGAGAGGAGGDDCGDGCRVRRGYAAAP